ncbi:MAG: MFS transporter [Gammaproteobacteria bacterium]|nr:MFS transporter [Gammaproteobacteria bacterium]
MTQAHDPAGTRLGYIWLQPGVTRLNGWTLLYVLFVSIGLLVFLNFQQPYVLEVMLDIPSDRHGRVVAQMALVHELVLIGFVGPFGALADRIGRRKVLTAGYLIMATGYMAYPFAESVTMLTAFRMIFALGAAAIISTFTTVLTDYPQEQSRGKLVALGSILNAIGLALLAGIGGQMIMWLQDGGISPVGAGRIAIVAIGLVGVVSALLVWLGLRGETLRLEHAKIPLPQLIREGFAAAKSPRIALAYAAAFIARGDVVVVGMYLSLWATRQGVETGMEPAMAQSKAGIMMAIVSVSPLPLAALFGILNDRIDRVTFLIIATGVATFGYLAFGSLDSPLFGIAIPVGIALGCGQVASIIAGQTLIGQEADPRIAGSTLGAFNAFGALGTLVGSVMGGYLFDTWSYGGPFIMMGFASLLVMLGAIWVRLRYGTAR